MKNLRNSNKAIPTRKPKFPKKLTPKNILIAFALFLLLITQVYSFKNEGEILGFQVRKVTTKQGLQGAPSSIKDETSDSIVCKTVSAEFVADQVGVKELQKSTLYKDIKRDNLTSNSTCIYTTSPKDTKEDDKVVVTVSLQEKGSADLATKEAQRIKERDDAKSIDGLGDEAYFSENFDQLVVRKDNKVVNVFIKVGSNSKVNVEEAARQISNKLLN